MARQQFPKRNADDAAQVARGGIRDRGAELPDRVQAAFDGHDLSGVRVHRNALVARKAMRALERRHDEEEGGDGAEGWAVQVESTLEWLQVSRRQVSAVREAMASAL